jgi:hypothetical protein
MNEIYISTDRKDYYGSRTDVIRELSSLHKRRENFLTLSRDLKTGSIQVFWLHDEKRYHIENTISKEKVYTAKAGSHDEVEKFLHAFMDLKGWRKMLEWEKVNFEPDV